MGLQSRLLCAVYKYTVCRRIQEKSDALCTERIALTDDVCVVFDETRTTR